MIHCDSQQITRDSIKVYLDKLLTSDTFAESPTLRHFLQFVVLAALQDKQQQIKEYVIGTEVFGRKETFDPRVDPIVRVEARRLRGKLNSYYSTEGVQDNIVIEIPKGGYRPSFSERPSVSSSTTLNALTATCRRDEKGIAVLPFCSLSPDAVDTVFTDGVTEELMTALTASDTLHVAPRTSVAQYIRQGLDVYELGHALNIRMLLEGSVRRGERDLRVIVRLVDSVLGYTIWSDTYYDEMANVFTTQETVCRKIAQVLTPKLLSYSHAFASSDDRLSPQHSVATPQLRHRSA
jgi:TolB-like protein